MDKRQIIKKLSAFHGVSGYEYRFSKDLCDMFSPFCDEVSIDTLGNVIGVQKSSESNGRSVMIEAHTDEIGLMITEIDEKGFLRFASVGGIDARILPGKEVIVHGTKDVLGIIGAKPPHITTAEERNKALPINELYIDTGYSKENIEKIVSVGDTAISGCINLRGTLTIRVTKAFGESTVSKILDMVEHASSRKAKYRRVVIHTYHKIVFPNVKPASFMELMFFIIIYIF